MSRTSPTDMESFQAAVKRLRAHEALRPPTATDDDMEQAWHDTLEELQGRVVLYAAMVCGEDRASAKVHSDVPTSAASRALVERALNMWPEELR